jgi:TP901 family phage tail tape measure protein
MAGQFKNSIQLGIQLPKQSDVQGQLNSVVKSLNNTKINLDVNIANSNVAKQLETLTTLANNFKSSIGENISLGDIDNAISQTVTNVQKMNTELKNNSTISNDKRLQELQKEIDLSNKLVEADQKRQTKDDSANLKAIEQENELLAKQADAYKQIDVMKANGIVSNDDISKLESMVQKSNSLKDMNKALNSIMTTSMMKESSIVTLSKQLDDAQVKLDKMKSTFGNKLPDGFIQSTESQINKLREDLTKVDGMNFNGIKNSLNDINTGMKVTNNETRELVNSLKETDGSFFSGISDFLGKAGIFVGVATVVQETVSSIKEGISTVIDMDTALGNLNKVVTMSKDQLNQMRDSAVQMGKELGRSSIEVANSQAEFGRLYKTQEEINDMTKASIIGANVMDGTTADQVAKSLTTIITSMKMEAKDSMTILDSMNEIQNNYRVSASTLSEALAQVGSTAYTSGANLQQVEGYITSIATATGKEGSEIGNSLKSMMSRIYKIGEEGMESEGRPEKMLQSMGVAVRDSEGNFKSFSDILSSLSVKWKDMSDTQKIATAQIVAGQNRYNDFMALMNNYDTAVNSTTTALNSQGSALKENSIHMQTAEAKLGTLKATTEELAYKMINSDGIKSMIDGLTSLVSALETVDGKTIAFTATIGGLVLVMSKLSALNKTLIAGEAVTGLSRFIAVLSGMQTTATTINGVTNATKALQLAQVGLIAETEGLTGLKGAWLLLSTGIKEAITSSLAFMATPLGLAISAIAVAVGIAVTAFTSYKEHQAQLEQQSKNLKDAIDGVNESLKNGDTKGASKQLDKAKEEQEQLQKLYETRKKLEGMSEDQFYSKMGGADKAQSIALVQHQIDELTNSIKENGLTVNEETGTIKEYVEAQEEVANAKIVDNVKEQTKSQLENRENLEKAKEEYTTFIGTVQGLYTEYQTLSDQESLSADQKTRLSEVCSDLQSKFTDLNVSVDENGVAHINNTPLIEDNISYLTSEGMTIETLTSIRLSDKKACSEWSIGNQQMTYQEVSNNIENYKAEIDAIGKLMEARSQSAQSSTASGTITDSAIDATLQVTKSGLEADASELESAKSKIDSIYGSIKAPVNNAHTVGGIDMSDYGGGNSKKGSSGKSDAEKEAEKAEKLAEEINKLQADIKPDRYLELNGAIKDINNQLEANKTLQEATTGEEHSRAIEQEIDLYNQKKVALANLNAEQQKEAQELKDKLSQYSFQFDANGKLINSEQRLLELQKSINAETGDTEEAKQKKEDDIKWLKDLQDQTKSYIDLVEDKIPDVTNQWNELDNTIKKVDEDQLRKYLETEQKTKEIELEVKQKSETNDLTKKIYNVSEDDYNDYTQSKKDSLEQEISDLQDRVDADEDDFSAKDALKVKQQELNDVEKESYDNIKDFQSVYEDIHNQRMEAIQDELDALEKEHDEQQNENDLLEKKKALTEAQNALDKAKEDKTVYTYSKNADGVWDFTWQSDTEAIKSAQSTYDDAKKSYDDTVADQAYEAEKAVLEQQLTDEQTILDTKQKMYDKQLKALETEQQSEKDKFEYHYSDMDKLVEQEMKDLNQKYGDNWKLIYDTIDKNLTDVEKRYDSLSSLKASIGIDGMASDSTTSSSTTTDDDGNVISSSNGSSSSGTDILNVNETKMKEQLQKYADALQEKLNTMNKYATKMIDSKANLESSILSIQDKSQDAQYNSLTSFAIKYTTFTDKFLEMLQLIYDFRYTNIVNLTTQMQDLIKSALLSCEEAYQDFVEMSEAMGIDVKDSVSINSALSQFNQYKESVADWTKTKEGMYSTPLADYVNDSDALKYYNNNISSYLSDEVLSKINTISLPNSYSKSISNGYGTLVNNKATSINTYYNIDNIEMTASTDDPTQTFNNIINYVNQKASLKSSN